MTDALLPTGPLGERLRELAAVFLKLGAISFGGPAAHIALMEDEVVRRRDWLTREEFLDLVGATNLIPGPNSTELAIHIGWQRARWAGLLVAGICFILPATLIVTALAWCYVHWGAMPELRGILYGVKPVVIAIVAQALIRLSQTAIRSRFLALLAAAGLALLALGMDEFALLAVSGTLASVLRPLTQRGSTMAGAVSPLTLSPLLVAAVEMTVVRLDIMFWSFLRIGSILFGSGYVLLAFLQSEFVDRLGWLTQGQLLDATAVGQVTPGPVFTTATFIGYVLAGPAGAAVATVGIFLPAFFFVAVSGPFIPRIRKSAVAGAFLDGVNVASLCLMTWVTWQLGRATIVDAWTALLAVASGLALFTTRINSAWLILAGAVIGLVSA